MSKPNLKAQAKRKRELAKKERRAAKDEKRALRKAERAAHVGGAALVPTTQGLAVPAGGVSQPLTLNELTRPRNS